MTALQGSCLCGEVRFEIDGPLMRSSRCHCRQCQKAHGAPFRTRARGAAADFRFLAGEELVSFYRSTPGTHRGFCKVCGAPVLVKFDERSRSAQTDPGAVALYGVALATLDDDPGVRPDAHAFINPVQKIAVLCICAIGLFAIAPLFWTLPIAFLSGTAAAGGMKDKKGKIDRAGLRRLRRLDSGSTNGCYRVGFRMPAGREQ